MRPLSAEWSSPDTGKLARMPSRFRCFAFGAQDAKRVRFYAACASIEKDWEIGILIDIKKLASCWSIFDSHYTPN
jgi:hypothetical protein